MTSEHGRENNKICANPHQFMQRNQAGSSNDRWILLYGESSIGINQGNLSLNPYFTFKTKN
jgi:hypothetical protein